MVHNAECRQRKDLVGIVQNRKQNNTLCFLCIIKHIAGNKCMELAYCYASYLIQITQIKQEQRKHLIFNSSLTATAQIYKETTSCHLLDVIVRVCLIRGCM